jgi:hypothetical protein
LTLKIVIKIFEDFFICQKERPSRTDGKALVMIIPLNYLTPQPPKGGGENLYPWLHKRKEFISLLVF